MADLKMDLNLEKILKNKDSVVIIVIIVLSLFIAKSMHAGQNMRYETMKKQISEEQEKGKVLERIVALSEGVKKAKERSWSTIDASFILDKFYNIGVDNGIKLKNIALGDKKDEKNYVSVTVSFGCETTYAGLVRLVKNLETYPMLLRMKSLNVSTPSEKSAQRGAALQVSINVDAIYLK